MSRSSKSRLTTLKPRIGTLQPQMRSIGFGEYRERGASASERGYDYEWQQYRKRWLREHPLCGDRVKGSSGEHSVCASESRVTEATLVDHIHRFHGKDDPLRMDPENHQSLCNACHDLKTKAEQRGQR